MTQISTIFPCSSNPEKFVGQIENNLKRKREEAVCQFAQSVFADELGSEQTATPSNQPRIISAFQDYFVERLKLLCKCSSQDFLELVRSDITPPDFVNNAIDVLIEVICKNPQDPASNQHHTFTCQLINYIKTNYEPRCLLLFLLHIARVGQNMNIDDLKKALSNLEQGLQHSDSVELELVIVLKQKLGFKVEEAIDLEVLADSAFYEERYFEALTLYERAHELDPENEDVLNELIRLQTDEAFGCADLDRAKSYLRKLYTCDDTACSEQLGNFFAKWQGLDDADILFLKAALELDINNVQTAIQLLCIANKRAPLDREITILLAECYFYNHDYTASENLLWRLFEREALLEDSELYLLGNVLEAKPVDARFWPWPIAVLTDVVKCLRETGCEALMVNLLLTKALISASATDDRLEQAKHLVTEILQNTSDKALLLFKHIFGHSSNAST